MRRRPKKRSAEEENILLPYREPGNCEFCGKWCRRREPAHIISRGAGGPSHPLNLVALGSTLTYQCQCHTSHHNGGRPTRLDLLDVVGRREGMEPWRVLEAIWKMRREKTQGLCTD